MSVSTTRRNADYTRLRELTASHPGLVEILRVQGNPPSNFVIRLLCCSMESCPGGTPIYRESHDIAIQLPVQYPISPPDVRVVTPIFNPHVFANGRVCLGSQWTPSESLDVLVLRLRSILVWDPVILDPKSPANSHAMAWANSHPERLPLDKSQIRESPALKPRISWR